MKIQSQQKRFDHLLLRTITDYIKCQMLLHVVLRNSNEMLNSHIPQVDTVLSQRLSSQGTCDIFKNLYARSWPDSYMKQELKSPQMGNSVALSVCGFCRSCVPVTRRLLPFMPPSAMPSPSSRFTLNYALLFISLSPQCLQPSETETLSGIHVPSGKAAGLALVCRSREGARVDIPRTQEHVWVGGGSGLRRTSALALTAHLRFLSLEGTGIGPTFYEYGSLLVKGTF